MKFAYVATKWIGEGKDWHDYWYCLDCHARRLKTDEEKARAEYAGLALRLMDVTLDPVSLEVAEKMTARMDALVDEYGTMTADWENPLCGKCSQTLVTWGLLMGLGDMQEQDYPDEGPQRPSIPQGYTRCEDVTGQFVHLAKGSPDPNVVVVKVEESREKHKGYLDALKLKFNQVVLEEWETDGEGNPTPVVRVATPTKLKNLLTKQGVSLVEADDIANTIPDVSVAKKLIRRAKVFEKATIAEPIPLPR